MCVLGEGAGIGSSAWRLAMEVEGGRTEEAHVLTRGCALLAVK